MSSADDAWLERYLDGDLSPAEEEGFITWLRSDPQHLGRFARALHLERSLSRPGPRAVARSTPSRGRTSTPAGPRPPRRARAGRRGPRASLVVAAAVLLLAVVGAVLASQHPSRFPSKGAVISTQQPWLPDAHLVPPHGLAWASCAQGPGCRILRAGACLQVTAGHQVVVMPDDLLLSDGPTQLAYADGTVITLAAQASCRLQADPQAPARIWLGLASGSLTAEVRPQPQIMRCDTAQARVEVVGTALAIAAIGGRTTTTVQHGCVRVERFADQAWAPVAAGQQLAVDAAATGPLQVITLAAGRRLSADPDSCRVLLKTLQPGDTLILAPGTYPQGLDLTDLAGSEAGWITISGPDQGAALIQAARGRNTIELAHTHHLRLTHLSCDGQHRADANGINASGGDGTWVHDLEIRDCILVNYDGSQQTTAISLRCAAWRCAVQGCQVSQAGTGIYIGDVPALSAYAGIRITGTAVDQVQGFALCLHGQGPWPTGIAPCLEPNLIARNRFAKDDRASLDGDRPTVLAEATGPEGVPALPIELYGNRIGGNAREALVQLAGSVSFHDNVLARTAAGAVAAIVLAPAPGSCRIYDNTVASPGTALHRAATAGPGEAEALGNLLIAERGLDGDWTLMQANQLVPWLQRAQVLQADAQSGAPSGHPRAGTVHGEALDLARFASDEAWDADADGVPRGDNTSRGACVDLEAVRKPADQPVQADHGGP